MLPRCPSKSCFILAALLGFTSSKHDPLDRQRSVSKAFDPPAVHKSLDADESARTQFAQLLGFDPTHRAPFLLSSGGTLGAGNSLEVSLPKAY